MATQPIHLHIPEVTTAEFLRGMLATCQSRADMAVWKQDFLDHVHLLTAEERMDVICKSSVRMFQIAGGAE